MNASESKTPFRTAFMAVMGKVAARLIILSAIAFILIIGILAARSF